MAVTRLNFFSRELGMSTNVTVILPSFDQGYELGVPLRTTYPLDKKWQVLWLLHGGSGDDADYLNWTNVARFAVEYNCAVVCPCDYNAGYNDYPDGAKYLKFITDELWEFCMARFPFSDKREDNFIGGLSMGSGGAMKLAVTLPEKYSYALIMSGGIGPKNAMGKGHSAFREKVIASGWPMPKQPSNIVRDNIEQILRDDVAAGKPVPTFIMACGDADNIAWEAHCNGVNIMKELGVNVIDFVVPGLKHEWDFWEICMSKAFKEWLPCKCKELSETCGAWSAPVEKK